MTTRSGRAYKTTSAEMVEGGATVIKLLKIMVEDRRRRDEEMAEEEFRELLAKLVESTSIPRETRSILAEGLWPSEPCNETKPGLKLTKLSGADDIEAYLTMFEHMMERMECGRWVYKLSDW